MATDKTPEVWLRGPVENIPALLQPIAHALLQAREEVNELLIDFPDNHLWDKPAEAASVGFHLQHLGGVLDRLFTYAKGETLHPSQLQTLASEGKPNPNIKALELVEMFNKQVEKSLTQLALTDEATLLESRGVGRVQIPSTVLGLLFHSAEHTMRHVGQLYVSVKVIKAADK